MKRRREEGREDNDCFQVTHSLAVGKVSGLGLTQKLPYEVASGIQSRRMESPDC